MNLLTDKSLWANALRHILIGVAAQIILWPAVGPTGGALFVTGFFLGRERRDTEIEFNIPIRHFYKGWAVWRWSTGTLADLIPVVVVAWLIAAVGEYYYGF